MTRFADFQTAEPPFADKDKAGLELSAIQLKVLWEAARQYREAVRDGDEKRIGATGRTLDAVLRQTKSGK